MFKHMKLSTKIAAGFSALVLIMVALGGLAILNMSEVMTESDKLSKEYVPEVSISNKMERNVLEMVINVRAFDTTNDKTKLEAAKKYLSNVKNDLKSADELSDRSAHLTLLKGAVAGVGENLSSYSDLLDQTAKAMASQDEIRASRIEAARLFGKSTEAFFNSQSENMVQEIREKVAPNKLEDRFKKIGLIQDVTELGNQIRIAAWKSEATNDPKFSIDSQKLFPEMRKKTEAMRLLTFQEQDLKLIAAMEESADSFLKELANMTKSDEQLGEIFKKRLEVTNKVIDSARDIAQKGIQQTDKISVEASTTLARSIWVLVVGLLFAFFIGCVIAYSVTMAVSRPLKKAIDGIKSATGQVSAASEQLSCASQQLSSGATEQAAAIEETSASLEEISGMVQNNVSNARSANELSCQVKNVSEQGNESMTKLQGAMVEILNSNDKIEQLVKVIGEIGQKTKVMDEIVFQTKLLSFNASVEAERAGEHGRGFAVVAQEVGNLAQMSGKAAQEIAQILTDSIKQAEAITNENKKKVELGNSHVTEAVKILREISVASAKVADGSSQVLLASEEQAAGIKQITMAMTNLDKATQENASTAEETESTSEELSSQAVSLNDLVQDLVNLVDGGNDSNAPSNSDRDFKAETTRKRSSKAKAKTTSANVVQIASGKKHPIPRPKNAEVKAVIGSDIASNDAPEDGWNAL